MNTKFSMTSSAVLMGVAGIVLIFLPKEVLNYFSTNSSGQFKLIIQIIGALYFSFAMLNWTAKDNRIGGIYNRPIAIANLTHFFVGTLLILKVCSLHPLLIGIWISFVIYLLLTIQFGIIFYKHPAKNSK